MAETIDTILERMLLQIPSRYDTSSGTYRKINGNGV